ncbi:MAG: biotin--[acetyl-CoA-carboxylase] ligase [Caldilineae bacterium]|nr:MAG: biotin--[acetyl-CoA-carboxylase] ligase [Caldilineae bacterium]
MKFVRIYFHRVTSTQDWVRAWARLGAAEGLVVQAGEQTAGRGRLQRSWWSPPGEGLYISVLLRATIPLRLSSHLTMLVSLAAVDACHRLSGLRPRPKWPNDLVLAGRKLAGVLTEIEQQNGQVLFAVIGLGLNVNQEFADTPLADKAISLRQACGMAFEIATVREAYLAALAERYDRFRRGESPLAAWAADLEPLGQRVCVQTGGQARWFGRAVDVSPEGALLVQDDGGEVRTVWAGDVIPVAQLAE